VEKCFFVSFPRRQEPSPSKRFGISALVPLRRASPPRRIRGSYDSGEFYGGNSFVGGAVQPLPLAGVKPAHTIEVRQLVGGRYVMKRLRMLFLSFVLVASSFAVCSAADIQIQTGLNFDWWADNQSSDATQFYVPLTITGGLNDFSFRVLTAYVNTDLDQSGVGTKLDCLIDTKVNLSYTIIDKLPVDVLMGLDFNLPTGKTNLTQSEISLIMDPDLISINNYGEGFDVNPTVTFAKEWGNWVGGIGFGYLWRGSYDFSSEINITDYQPGEVFNANAELRYFFSPAMYARFFGSYAWYGTDTVEGSDYYQQGDYFQLGLGLYYNQGKQWDAGVTFRGIFRDKAQIQGSPGVIVTEPNDSWGDEWVVDVAARYLPDEKTALRFFIQGRYFSENDYPSDSPFYVGKREKLSLGVGVTRALAPHLEAGLDIRGFIKHDDEANYPQIQSARDFNGFSATLMLTGTF